MPTPKKPVKKAPTKKSVGGQHRTPQVADSGEKPIEYPATPLATVQSNLAKKFATSSDTAPHVVIEARAGTGKTTTLVSALQVLKGQEPRAANGSPIVPSPQQAVVWDEVAKSPRDSNVTFVAFNKAIATELGSRVPAGCQAMTMHSMGFKAVTKSLGRQEPTDWAVQELIAELCGTDTREMRKKDGTILTATNRLVSLCKMNLVGATDLDEDRWEEALDGLAGHYDVELNGSRSRIFDLVPRVLEKCKDPQGRITYDDMIWLPVVLGLSVPKADLLLIDERQDLNKCQMGLALRAGNRIIAVGDSRQSIYGFAGADAMACQNFAEMLKSRDARGLVELPLTVTRRCGKAIVVEANKIVPDFEAHESNPEGRITSARYPFQKNALGETEELPWNETYMPQAQAGDMLLCRTNAPLVTNCFRFLRKGIKANIQGRDVGQGLIATVNKLAKGELLSINPFVGLLSDWHINESGKESAKKYPSETRLIGLQDRYECLLAFTEGASHTGDVVRKIEEVFTDNKFSPGLRFSSIHKAKGLEAKRVFFLKPKTVFARPPKRAWEAVQAENLEYVAITRAIEELTYVS